MVTRTLEWWLHPLWSKVQTIPYSWKDSCMKVQRQLHNAGIVFFKHRGKWTKASLLSRVVGKRREVQIHVLPSVISRTSFWPAAKIGGMSELQFSNQLVCLPSSHSPVNQAPQRLSFLALWLAGLFGRVRKHLPPVFSLVKVQLLNFLNFLLLFYYGYSLTLKMTFQIILVNDTYHLLLMLTDSVCVHILYSINGE